MDGNVGSMLAAAGSYLSRPIGGKKPVESVSWEECKVINEKVERADG